MILWKLLAIVLGVATVGLAALTAWQRADRARLLRRFAGIVDVEREIAARRRTLNLGIAESQRAFDAELAARRHGIYAELAKQTTEIELAQHNATQELAETMRRTSEMRQRYASSKAVYDRLRAELAVLRPGTGGRDTSFPGHL